MALLERRLADAEETLRALRAGEVDAIVQASPHGEQLVYILETEERPYRWLVEGMSAGAALVDADGLITYANQRLATLLGVQLERLLGRLFSDWLDEPERLDFIQRLAAPACSRHDEYTLRRSDGGSVSVLVGLTVPEDPEVTLRYVTVTDLSQQVANQQEVQRLNDELTERLVELRNANSDLELAQRLLTHRTLHDPLTGLPNRMLFLNRLEQSLADAARSGQPVAVYFVDLDGFKRINDTFGHNAGDRMLQEVAERLSSLVRPGDTVARFAGDEFLVLTPGAMNGANAAQALADRMLVSLTRPPLQEGGQVVTASIGLTLSHEGIQPEELIRQADAAMYHAKHVGKARWELFGPDLRERLLNRLTTEQQLRRALSGDGVQVLYQPVVDLTQERQLGAEALVRLRLDSGGLQSPTTFIATAEETGLVLPLGRRVLQRSCEQPKRWQARSGHPWFVSVNISPRQLAEADLVADVRAALASAELPGDQLRLEVTESALMETGPKVLNTLRQLRELGVGIGVDDFGTGFASMSYVRHLPLDFIKIDQSFVSGMLNDPHDLAMVEATLALSHRLGLRSVAEGIETQAQWAELHALGCDEGQGFLFGGPTTAELVCSGRGL